MFDIALFSPAAILAQPPLPKQVASYTAMPSDAAAGGTGADAGGYDTSTNRDAMLAVVANQIDVTDPLRSAAISAGFVSAGVVTRGAIASAALFSPARIRHQSPLPTAQTGVETVPADAPAGGTGAAGGCYDTAGHRDSWIGTINNLIDVLTPLRAACEAAATGETATPSVALFSPAAIAAHAPYPVQETSVEATPADPPAGGTGATAGGYDTAPHRDAAIVTINALNDVLGDVRSTLVGVGLVS